MNLDIIDRAIHPNKGGSPFVAAIIDDADDGKTKLVIQFEEEGCTAVLLLDSLIEEENIAVDGPPAAYEELREKLWNR
jgi:hypothetical protein